MEEAHELSARQLLALPRRELQARAKAAGVPANLKSQAIVDAMVALHAGGSRAAAAAGKAETVHTASMAKDVTPSRDARKPSSPGTSYSPSVQSLPVDMQPLHLLGKGSVAHSQGSPIARLTTRHLQLGGSPMGMARGSSPAPHLEAQVSPLGKPFLSLSLRAAHPHEAPQRLALGSGSSSGALADRQPPAALPLPNEVEVPGRAPAGRHTLDPSGADQAHKRDAGFSTGAGRGRAGAVEGAGGARGGKSTDAYSKPGVVAAQPTNKAIQRFLAAKGASGAGKRAGADANLSLNSDGDDGGDDVCRGADQRLPPLKASAVTLPAVSTAARPQAAASQVTRGAARGGSCALGADRGGVPGALASSLDDDRVSDDSMDGDGMDVDEQGVTQSWFDVTAVHSPMPIASARTKVGAASSKPDYGTQAASRADPALGPAPGRFPNRASPAGASSLVIARSAQGFVLPSPSGMHRSPAMLVPTAAARSTGGSGGGGGAVTPGAKAGVHNVSRPMPGPPSKSPGRRLSPLPRDPPAVNPRQQAVLTSQAPASARVGPRPAWGSGGAMQGVLKPLSPLRTARAAVGAGKSGSTSPLAAPPPGGVAGPARGTKSPLWGGAQRQQLGGRAVSAGKPSLSPLGGGARTPSPAPAGRGAAGTPSPPLEGRGGDGGVRRTPGASVFRSMDLGRGSGALRTAVDNAKTQAGGRGEGAQLVRGASGPAGAAAGAVSARALPAIGRSTKAPEPSAKAAGRTASGGPAQGQAGSSPEMHLPAVGGGRSLGASSMPMKSPLRTPARRVTAQETQAPGHPGMNEAAHNPDAQRQEAAVLEAFVRAKLEVPAQSYPGFKSVIGLASIKQQLLSAALPALAPRQGSTAAAQGAASGTEAASSPGEVPWFKPILIFGPSGVGKTLMARALATELATLAFNAGGSAAGRASGVGSAGGGAVGGVRPAAAVGGRSRTVSAPGVAASCGSGGVPGGGKVYYVDIKKLLGSQAEGVGGAQADKVVQALFKALRNRSSPTVVILDNLEALHALQRSGTFSQAEAASRLRTALLVGFDDVLYPSPMDASPEGTAPGAGAGGVAGATGRSSGPAQNQGPQLLGRGGSRGLAGPGGVRTSQQLMAGAGPRAAGDVQGSGPGAASGAGTGGVPLVVVGVAGAGAGSVDDGLARRFTAAKVYVPLPDLDTREALVFLQMASQEADLSVDDIATLARRTEGFSGAEVLNICTQAASAAAASPPALGREAVRRAVRLDHFEAVFERVRPALGHAAAVQYFKWKSHLVQLEYA